MRANRYVSYLAAEIEPRALTTLSQFERATEKAFARIDSFSNRGAAKMGLTTALPGMDSRARSNIVATETALRSTRAELGRTSTAMKTTAASSNLAATAFARSAQSLTVVQGSLGPLAGRLSALGGIFRDLSGISIAGVLGGGAAFALASVATQYQQVTDRLRPFYDTQVQTNDAMRDVIKIARDTRQALDPVAQLYTRLTQAGKDAGITRGIPQLTETVAKAARLSGGDAETQKNGLTQFAQGFGAQTLNGDELKSIRENTFRLAKALADGLGVPISKLKELGAEGKLTPKVISAALARSAAQIDLEFSRLPKRIGASLTEANNAFSIFVGRLDESAGATSGIAEAISAAANNLPILLIGLSGVAARMAAVKLADPFVAVGRNIARARDAQNQFRAATTAGTATPLTPTGIARGKALTNAATTGAAANAARDEVAARRASIVAIDGQVAALKAKQSADLVEARTTRGAAQAQLQAARDRANAAIGDVGAAAQAARVRGQADAAAAQARLAAVRKEVAESTSLRLAAERRVAQARSTGTTAAADPSLNRANRARIVEQAARAQALAEAEVTAALNAETAATARLTAAETDLAAARARAQGGSNVALTTAELQAKNALVVTDLRLVEAEAAYAAALTAEAGAQTRANTTGFAAFALAEQRLAAERALAAAIAAKTVADQAAAVAMVELTVAQRAYNAAAQIGARAAAGLQKAGSALASFLGGPLGIALTAAAVAFTYLATRTSAAQAAMDNFSGGQDELNRRLGITTKGLQAQSQAARDLQIALAETELTKAKAARNEAGEDLAKSLGNAGDSILVRGLLGPKAREDVTILNEISERARRGEFNLQKDFPKIREIQQRNPNSFKSGAIASMLGGDPVEYASKAKGVAASNLLVMDSERALADTRRANAKAPPPIVLGPTRTKSQLEAQAMQDANAVGTIKRARADYAATKAKLDADLANKENPLSQDDYVKGLADARVALNMAEAAERERTKAVTAGAVARRAAIREATVAEKAAIQRGEQLADIMGRYDTAPSAADAAANAKRTIDSFFRKTLKGGTTITLDAVKVGDKLFTAADAAEVKRQIDTGLRKPIADAIRDQERELDIARLILAGRSDEADLLRQKVQLLDTVGGQLLPAEEAALRRNAAMQRSINADIEKRTKLIDINARAIGDVQNAIRDAVAGGASVKTLKDFAGNIQKAFRNAVADRISVSLFGDAEQAYRDKMTRGLNDSAGRLTTSADRLDAAAEKLTEAAGAQRVAVEGESTGGVLASTLPTALSASLSDNIGDLLAETRDAVAGALGTARAPQKDDDGEVIIRGRAPVRQGALKIDDPVTLFNQVGKDFATKLFGPNSILTRAASKLGTFVEGAGYGQAGNTLAKGAGARGSVLGSAIGGGLAKTFGTDLAKQGLTAISSKLGQFAGPLAGIAGGVIGSLVGGALKKTKKASASISSVDGAASVSGTKSLQGNATGLAKNVQGGVQSIIDALGGTAGSFNVAIGQRKKKFVVDSSGSGRTKGSGTTSFETEAEATAAAILDAIMDGAVRGIRRGSQVLISSGKDLDRQVAKAVKFEAVFTQLKEMTDPVGAAVDSLNKEFSGLIDIFNEAGASTSEFADLQKLYDLRRADAIKQATDASVSALQEFINGNTKTADSPLGRTTVYRNAKGAVDAFRGDIEAGKAVDVDKLVEALTNFQDASGALNGSRSAFYNDFEDIMSLAARANAALTGNAAIAGPLAPSPFDPVVKTTLQDTLAATKNLATVMENGLSDVTASLKAAFGGGSGGAASSLGYLPSQIRQN